MRPPLEIYFESNMQEELDAIQINRFIKQNKKMLRKD